MRILSKTRIATALGAILGVIALAPTTNARAEDAIQPMALRQVMIQLGSDMQAVTAAISKEDWPRVANLAHGIASHAQPPMGEKMRILTWLGSDAARFRGFDKTVHEAGDALGDAARRADGPAVVDAFRDIQQGCLACHQSFRSAFLEHFYPSK